MSICVAFESVSENACVCVCVISESHFLSISSAVCVVMSVDEVWDDSVLVQAYNTAVEQYLGNKPLQPTHYSHTKNTKQQQQQGNKRKREDKEKPEQQTSSQEQHTQQHIQQQEQQPTVEQQHTAEAQQPPADHSTWVFPFSTLVHFFSTNKAVIPTTLLIPHGLRCQ